MLELFWNNLHGKIRHGDEGESSGNRADNLPAADKQKMGGIYALCLKADTPYRCIFRLPGRNIVCRAKRGVPVRIHAADKVMKGTDFSAQPVGLFMTLYSPAFQ